MTDLPDLVTLRPPVPEELENLSRAECIRLLDQVGTARLAWVDGNRARVVPVTIAVVDGAVLFWSGPGRKLDAAVAGEVFTIEAERLEPALHLGWSIEIVGRASLVHDAALGTQLRDRGLRPWFRIEEPTLIRVPIEEISGRRLPEVPATVEHWWFEPAQD